MIKYATHEAYLIFYSAALILLLLYHPFEDQLRHRFDSFLGQLMLLVLRQRTTTHPFLLLDVLFQQVPL